MLYVQSDGASLQMRGKMVPLGDRAMSRELTYIHPGGRGGEPGLEIRIEVLGRAPVVTSVLLTAVPGGNGVRVTDLKSIAARLEELAEWMCATAAWVQNSRSSAFKDWPISADSRQAAMPSIRRARKQSRRKITDDLLRQVAEVYRNAGSAPTNAVKRAFGCSDRTAGRYVTLAREAGLLPETTQGKVSK